jgi:hypothetical protein
MQRAADQLIQWAAKAAALLAVLVYWNTLDTLSKIALVLVLTAILLAAVHTLLKLKLNSHTQIKQYSLLDVLQGATISQHIPEIIALSVLALSSEEQVMILKRLPQSLQDLMTTKIVYLLPEYLQNLLGVHDNKDTLSPVDAPHLPDFTLQDIPSDVAVKRNPIRKKRFEDLPELRENLFVKIFAHRISHGWREMRSKALTAAWISSGLLCVYSLVRSKFVLFKRVLLMWLILCSLKVQKRWGFH